jgi:hypothetical protein
MNLRNIKNFFKTFEEGDMISFIEAPILADQLERARLNFDEKDPRFGFIMNLHERLVDATYNRKFSRQESLALDDIFMQAGLYTTAPFGLLGDRIA